MALPHRPFARVALPLAVASALIAAPASPAEAAGVPFAAGDSSGNIPLKAANRWVANRWVADKTGTIDKLHVRVRTAGATACADDPGTGYGAGTAGTWLATTHPVTATGEPDLGVALSSDVVSPCGEKNGNSIAIDLDFRVRAGDVLVTVVRNVDPNPAINYASQNFLYASNGLVGANARNELTREATDTFYGIDPREVVGYSADGGLTWSMPGGPYPALVGGKAFIPTFIEEYSDGSTAGQPFYSSHLYDEKITMVYRIREQTRVTALGAYTSARGSGEVTMTVNDKKRAEATLSGLGHLKQAIDPVNVDVGDRVEVTTTAGANGLPIRQNYGGAVWARIARLGTGRDEYLLNRPAYVAPLYPLGKRVTSGGSPTDPPEPGGASGAPGRGADNPAPTEPPNPGVAQAPTGAGGAAPVADTGAPTATAVRPVAPRRGSCVVPKLTRRTLKTAKARVSKAGCRLGRVKRRKASRVRAGLVTSQAVAPGKRIAVRSPISLVVARR